MRWGGRGTAADLPGAVRDGPSPSPVASDILPRWGRNSGPTRASAHGGKEESVLWTDEDPFRQRASREIGGCHTQDPHRGRQGRGRGFAQDGAVTEGVLRGAIGRSLPTRKTGRGCGSAGASAENEASVPGRRGHGDARGTCDEPSSARPLQGSVCVLKAERSFDFARDDRITVCPPFSNPGLKRGQSRAILGGQANRTGMHAGSPDVLNRGIWVKIPGGAATVKRKRKELPRALPSQ